MGFRVSGAGGMGKKMESAIVGYIGTTIKRMKGFEVKGSRVWRFSCIVLVVGSFYAPGGVQNMWAAYKRRLSSKLDPQP